MLYLKGDIPAAVRTLEAAVDLGDPDASAQAAVHLGLARAANGDMPGAIAAYRSAIDSGNITYLPDAAIMLGDLMDRNGDTTAARDAYNRALETGDAKAEQLAARQLAALGEPAEDA